MRDAKWAELPELYSDTWRRDDEPILSEEELTANLRWQLLCVSPDDDVPVTFTYDADDLLGGHIVAIEVNGETNFREIDLKG